MGNPPHLLSWPGRGSSSCVDLRLSLRNTLASVASFLLPSTFHLNLRSPITSTAASIATSTSISTLPLSLHHRLLPDLSPYHHHPPPTAKYLLSADLTRSTTAACLTLPLHAPPQQEFGPPLLSPSHPTLTRGCTSLRTPNTIEAHTR